MIYKSKREKIIDCIENMLIPSLAKYRDVDFYKAISQVMFETKSEERMVKNILLDYIKGERIKERRILSYVGSESDEETEKEIKEEVGKFLK